MSNITVFLDNNALIHDRPAVVDPTENLELTFWDLLSLMSGTARALANQGIGRGDRVCIYLDSSPGYLVSYFAIWRIGAIAVPANISLHQNELLHRQRKEIVPVMTISSLSAESEWQDTRCHAVSSLPGLF